MMQCKLIPQSFNYLAHHELKILATYNNTIRPPPLVITKPNSNSNSSNQPWPNFKMGASHNPRTNHQPLQAQPWIELDNKNTTAAETIT